VDWFKENWKADRDDKTLMTRSRSRSVLEYFRPLMMRESWDHFDFGDLRVTTTSLREVAVHNLRGLGSKIAAWLWRRKLARTHHRTCHYLLRSSSQIQSVLFLCYGNICRSAFAEQYARKKWADVDVQSAGFFGQAGRKSPDHMRIASTEYGVSLDNHVSRCVSRQVLEGVDLIVVMDALNYKAVLEVTPDIERRLIALGPFSTQGQLEVPDPYTLDSEATRQILDGMAEALDALYERFLAIGWNRQLTHTVWKSSRRKKISERE
jgi:protein-tyrosine phosphatase